MAKYESFFQRIIACCFNQSDKELYTGLQTHLFA
jgi:hypothetical protein